MNTTTQHPICSHLPRTSVAPVWGVNHRLRGRRRTVLGLLNGRIKRHERDPQKNPRAHWGDVLAIKFRGGQPAHYRDEKTGAIRSVIRDHVRTLRAEAARAAQEQADAKRAAKLARKAVA